MVAFSKRYTYNQTVIRAGCSKSEDSLDCLRKLSSEELIAINVDICTGGFYGTFVFAPVVDGSFIKQRPSHLIKRGRLNTDLLLTVTDTYEGVALVPSTWSSTVQEYMSNLFPLLVVDGAELYEGLGTTLEQIGSIMGEATFTCPAYALLRGNKRPASKGHFAVPPARHAGDVAYYYPSNGLAA